MIDAWTGNDGSKDGVDKGMFPLTAEDQQRYSFQRAGPYRLSYAPRTKNSAAWKGDLTVDPATLQLRNINSTLVNSALAYRIPSAAKVIFGISLKQVGYSVTYDKTIDDLWFPGTSGTEFSIRLLFGYARTLILSTKNYDFRRASAESTIRFEPSAKEEPKR